MAQEERPAESLPAISEAEPLSIDHEPTAEDTPAFWVAWVREPLGKAVENIIQYGQRLSVFRNQFPHGDWEAALKEQLHLSKSTVAALIRIAEHPVLSNVEHVLHLPPSWGTLRELSKLRQATLKEKIESGEINSSMERSHAVKLVREEARAEEAEAEEPTLEELEEEKNKVELTKEVLDKIAGQLALLSPDEIQRVKHVLLSEEEVEGLKMLMLLHSILGDDPTVMMNDENQIVVYGR